MPIHSTLPIFHYCKRYFFCVSEPFSLFFSPCWLRVDGYFVYIFNAFHIHTSATIFIFNADRVFRAYFSSLKSMFCCDCMQQWLAVHVMTHVLTPGHDKIISIEILWTWMVCVYATHAWTKTIIVVILMCIRSHVDLASTSVLDCYNIPIQLTIKSILTTSVIVIVISTLLESALIVCNSDTIKFMISECVISHTCIVKVIMKILILHQNGARDFIRLSVFPIEIVPSFLFFSTLFHRVDIKIVWSLINKNRAQNITTAMYLRSEKTLKSSIEKNFVLTASGWRNVD